VVHPPLGKWLIAAGEQIFGYNSLGWRFSAAVVGSLAILVVGRTARRLTRSTLLGCFAALLMSLDALEFVQSRASMLDIFLMFWIAAAFACIVADRDWTRARLADVTAPVESSGPRVGVRWWRVGAGFCLGCACATKWDGVFYVAALLLLTSFWDAGARRTIGVRRPIRAMLRRDLPASVSSYVGLAFAVYVVSWTGWFLGDANTAWDHDRYVHGQGTFGHAVAVAHGWLSYHTEILAFHDSLHASHPYQSHPIGWLLLARPVSYFYTSPKTGQAG
jgi:dolichyl-phosphate-mannose--protein O-mannosyl transferase